MDARLNLHGNTIAAKIARHVNAAGAVVTSSSLPAATQELVKIRASQIPHERHHPPARRDYQPGQWG